MEKLSKCFPIASDLKGNPSGQIVLKHKVLQSGMSGSFNIKCGNSLMETYTLSDNSDDTTRLALGSSIGNPRHASTVFNSGKDLGHFWLYSQKPVWDVTWLSGQTVPHIGTQPSDHPSTI